MADQEESKPALAYIIINRPYVGIYQAEGNAHLMSAAPELYAACKAALEFAPHGETCTASECRCWRRFAKAAVEKAETDK